MSSPGNSCLSPNIRVSSVSSRQEASPQRPQTWFPLTQPYARQTYAVSVSFKPHFVAACKLVAGSPHSACSLRWKDPVGESVIPGRGIFHKQDSTVWVMVTGFGNSLIRPGKQRQWLIALRPLADGLIVSRNISPSLQPDVIVLENENLLRLRSFENSPFFLHFVRTFNYLALIQWLL